MHVITGEDYDVGAILAIGQAHSVSADPDPTDEAVRLLHEAVKTVTGRDVEPPVKPRMGFLP